MLKTPKRENVEFSSDPGKQRGDEPAECDLIRVNMRDWLNELERIDAEIVRLARLQADSPDQISAARREMDRVSILPLPELLADWANLAQTFGSVPPPPRIARRLGILPPDAPFPAPATRYESEVQRALDRARLQLATAEQNAIERERRLSALRQRRQEIDRNMRQSRQRFSQLPCNRWLPR